MEIAAFYPYRSQELKDFCLAYFDSVAAREWPVTSEGRMVPTSYGPTFVRIGGPPGAAPLVLLHGAGATSLMWRPNIQALSAEYRTIAVDQIEEIGRSVCTKPIQSLDDLLRWLNELFDGLELTRGVNLAGLSYGGALAAQCALHFPERLNCVILLAPGNTVLRLRVEFILRLILSLMISRNRMKSFVRWMFKDMARKDPGWIRMVADEIVMQQRSLQRRNVP